MEKENKRNIRSLLDVKSIKFYKHMISPWMRQTAIKRTVIIFELVPFLFKSMSVEKRKNVIRKEVARSSIKMVMG